MSYNKVEIEKLIDATNPTRIKLYNHPLYKSITEVSHLKYFMSSHIYAVWDFMSIVKGLQRQFTSINLPWTPSENPEICRLINEIVLDEESDLDLNGNPFSHFSMYLNAMIEFDVDTLKIEKFICKVNESNLDLALKEEQLPDGVHEFVSSTFDVINENDIIKLASMFTFGRENIIPDMFINIVEELEKSSTSKLSQFIFYLKRHIELDAGKHQDICFLMLSKVCKNNSANWEVATSAANEALKARLKFWDSIFSNIVS